MREVRRMVVKVGTAIITEESGKMDERSVGALAGQLAAARRSGIDIALVSSGAIASGLEKIGLDSRPGDIETLQAVAAVGQGLLMRMYSDVFGELGVTVGQVLLTQQDMGHRQQYLNARHTLDRLFEMGVVPVINENDTVATEEIAFGENDMLAALVAALVGADLLVLLTDTEGLFTADPRKSTEARLLERVDQITDEIECLGGESGSQLSSGGMSSKIQAVKTAVASGVDAVIADGREKDVITDILAGGKIGTRFPSSGKVTSKKHWIGYVRKSKGRLVVDRGAARAITREGRSLLPAGVVRVEGSFRVGDSVDIVDENGKIIARGLSNYDHDEADRIMGLRSDEVVELLGEAQELVHRDGLVVLEETCG